MNVATFVAYHTERAERLRRLKEDRDALGLHIQRARIEHDTMCEEIAMLEDHTAKDAVNGSYVAPEQGDEEPSPDEQPEERRAA